MRRFSPPSTQILVVDDGGVDPGVAQACVRHGVERIELPGHSGFCRAMNQGLAHARGEIVEFLNDDTVVTAGWIEQAIRHFRDPAIAAVCPLVLQGQPEQGDDPRIDSMGDHYFLVGFARKNGHGRRLGPSAPTGRDVFGANGCASFFRARVLREVGGLPESFGAYFEDVDLSWKLRRAGFRVRFEPRSVVFHLGGASHGRPRGDLLRQQSRNEEWVFWRNTPDPLLLACLPGHALMLVGKACLRAREGQFRAWWRGRLDAWRSMPDVLAHRRRMRDRFLSIRRAKPSIPSSGNSLDEGDRGDESACGHHHGVPVGLGDHVPCRR